MNTLSRRAFLRFSAIGLGSFVLSACGPKETSASPTLPPTLAPPTQVEKAIPNQPKETTKPKSKKVTPTPSEQTPSPATAKIKDKKATAAPSSTRPGFIATEILGRPTDTSMTVNVVPAAAMPIYYEFGTTQGAYTAKTAPQSAEAGVPLETIINGLKPNTRYYYHLRYGDQAGPEQTFVTQRPPGSPFTFAIQGDSHPERVGKQFDAVLYTRTLESAAAGQPDFYITIGDDFSVDTLKTVNAETVRAIYINQRQWLGKVGAPVFLVNGNHEQASLANLNGTANNIAVWAQTARNTYYPQPAPDSFYSGDADPIEHIGLLRDYYAFTWGDALFVVIDPYWHSAQTVDNTFGTDRDQKANRDLWNVTLGDAQYQWFAKTLATSTAKYKFVFTHHVLGTGRGGTELAHGYEWGDAAGLAAHRPGWDKTIHQLIVDHHVTIFFQGHDHIFVRQVLDGVIYQTLPEPANPNYTYENTDSYRSGDKFPNSGHLSVQVSSSEVKVDYIRSYLEKTDELAFSYTVN